MLKVLVERPLKTGPKCKFYSMSVPVTYPFPVPPPELIIFSPQTKIVSIHVVKIPEIGIRKHWEIRRDNC